MSRLHEQFGYVYDPAGNLNWRTNNDLVQSFGVNNLNELTTASRTTNMTVVGTTTSQATNVAVNNLTAALYSDSTFARTNVGLADGNNTFTAIAEDHYGRRDTNSVTVNLPTTNVFAYDQNGNMVTNGTETLLFDDENQLVTNYVAGSWKSEFVYDGLHRRRIERDYAWNGASWALTNETRLIYDGNVVIQHRDGRNLPTLTLTRGLDLSGTLQRAGGIGGLLALTQPSAITSQHLYYHSDGSGNVTCLINSNQVVVAKAAYDPYGGFLSCSGPGAGLNCYWFSSKPVHWQSGKYDFLNRWYLPGLQRWLSRDPIGEAGGISLYRYVRHDPLSRIDAFGLAWWRPGDSDYILDFDHAVQFYMGLGEKDSQTLDAANAQYLLCNSPLRGAYAFGGIQTPKDTRIGRSHFHGEGIGFRGYDMSEGWFTGVLFAGGAGVDWLAGGYEYAGGGHSGGIVLFDPPGVPIGGFMSDNQIGFYIYTEFEGVGVAGAGVYFDFDKLVNYINPDYWKGKLPCGCK